MSGIKTEAERAQRERDTETLRAYAATLPDGEEKSEIMEAITEGEQSLRAYAEAPTPPASPLGAGPADPEEDDDETPGADGDDGDDDLTDDDLTGMIADLRAGTAAPGAQAPADTAAPRQYSERTPAQPQTAQPQTLHLYSGEQGARLAELERGRIDGALDTLAGRGVITPAQASEAKLLCYSLKGLPGTAQLKTYSDTASGRDDMVRSVLTILSEGEDLGILRTYTATDHRQGEVDRVPADTASRAGHAPPVNESSADLTAKIRKYAEQHGIQDFGAAMIAYEKANPQEVKRYTEGG